MSFMPRLSTEWVIKTLETIASRHRDLQRISVYVAKIWSSTNRGDGVTIERVVDANPGTE